MEGNECPSTQAGLFSLLFGGRQVGSLSEVRNGPALEVPRTENGEVFGYK